MDKRREVRISRNIPIRFIYDGKAYQSLTGDISRRGIFIQTAHSFPCRNGINIEIQCHNKALRMAGFIVWSKKTSPGTYLILRGGMGIQLLDYQKQEYQALLAESS